MVGESTARHDRTNEERIQLTELGRMGFKAPHGQADAFPILSGLGGHRDCYGPPAALRYLAGVPSAMRRMKTDEVVMDLAIAIRLIPKWMLVKLRGLQPEERGGAADAIAVMLAAKVSNEHRCVVQSDMRVIGGQGYNPGRFGTDEPWPEGCGEDDG